ncbi:hypothetical protein Pyn_35579 [Prunus yedoensis var. nudiflora]|uniref:Uncharacterized protein n=1 Tax=Prunus yedoensis var. nudiflora TaxID=2094558 RepID=A0A314Z8I0_PRUYE|nr:hypothetical protein Pyn_35579 [Prunus yedoensis var. nudiflora]
MCQVLLTYIHPLLVCISGGIIWLLGSSRWSFLCSFYKFSMEIWSNGMMEETSVVHHLYVWMRKAWIRST